MSFEYLIGETEKDTQNLRTQAEIPQGEDYKSCLTCSKLALAIICGRSGF